MDFYLEYLEDLHNFTILPFIMTMALVKCILYFLCFYLCNTHEWAAEQDCQRQGQGKNREIILSAT